MKRGCPTQKQLLQNGGCDKLFRVPTKLNKLTYSQRSYSIHLLIELINSIPTVRMCDKRRADVCM